MSHDIPDKTWTPMYPDISYIESSSLPKSTDVTIIGGGIIGISTALYLARSGVQVTVLEKGWVAAEQSCRNWGWCRTMGRDINEIPLAIESLELWDSLSKEISDDLGFQRTGIVYACRNEKEMTEQKLWLEQASKFGITSRVLDKTELEERLNNITNTAFIGGLYTPDEGRAEPDIAVPALARYAQSLGVKIIQQCAVRDIEITDNKVTSVLTEHGKLKTNVAVLSGGVWSSTFCRRMGIRLPQLKVLGSVMRTAPIEGGPEGAFGTTGFSFRKRADGGYTIAHRGGAIAPVVSDSFRYLNDFRGMMRASHDEFSISLDPRRLYKESIQLRQWTEKGRSPFERERVLDPAPSRKLLDRAYEDIKQALPFFKNTSIIQQWGGYIDVTPDAIPVIDRMADIQGAYLSTGFSGHGFGAGPGAGKMMADMIINTPDALDSSPYRLNRF